MGNNLIKFFIFNNKRLKLNYSFCLFYSKFQTKQTYRDAMLTLKLLTAEQVSLVFSELDSLLPLHRNLIQKIKDIRRSDGRIDDIGRVFLEWVCYKTFI